MTSPPSPTPAVAPPRFETPWAEPPEAVLEHLGVQLEAGLSLDEVECRRVRHGWNRLTPPRRARALRILLRQFRSLIMALLASAMVVSFVFGEWIDAVAVAIVILLSVLLGFAAELRAVRSMEALRRLGEVTTRVRRNGQDSAVSAATLVPGDIVLLDSGDAISADLRIVTASSLQLDESTLTGESLPVGKDSVSVDSQAPLFERSSMLWRGTTVTSGAGSGVVTATGTETELGKIATLVEQTEDETTPIEKRLEALSRRLIGVTLVVAALTFLTGFLSGRDFLLMMQTSIALAVAAIPEGLPIVATIALARGMWHMARQNAIVNRLSAVETLGATSVIFTDKTGTLTENRLRLQHVILADHAVDLTEETAEPATDDLLRYALEIGVLCNSASLTDAGEGGSSGGVGDPLEVALLLAGSAHGLTRPDLLSEKPEEKVFAFDPVTRRMATIHREGSGRLAALKGAAESLLEISTHELNQQGEVALSPSARHRWLEREAALASRGLRVLAVARKTLESTDDDPFVGTTFVGLLGLLDPPRADVSAALADCQSAGIRVVMVTGDHPTTARETARSVGLTEDAHARVLEGRELASTGDLLDVPIFSRVSPAEKLDLIALHQEAGSVVAMTGDGVNDAPALKKADIGIAMGMRGTDVAREAADVILKDDAFRTIVVAVRQGRVIFDNIRRFIFYLLSCNLSEVMIVTAATTVDAPLPILPIQILFLNLVTDVFPALALAFGDGDPAVLLRPPRDPKEPILRRGDWFEIAGFGVVITICVLTALFLALGPLGFDTPRAVTVSFLTLAFAQLGHVFNVRDRGSRFLQNDVIRNRWVWGALALCTGLLVLAVYLPGVSTALGTVDPGARGWWVVAGMSSLPLILGQIWIHLRGARLRRAVDATSDDPTA